MNAGVDECFLDLIAIDRHRRLVGMLLDNRKQVPQESLLDRGKVRALDRIVILGMAETIHPHASSRQDRRRRVARAILDRCGLRPARACLIAPADRSAQALGGWFALVRYRLPSSYRWVYTLYEGARSSAVGARPAIARAGRSRSRLTSSSSASTRTNLPAKRADRPCGPSPRSRCSSSPPAARSRALRSR